MPRILIISGPEKKKNDCKSVELVSVCLRLHLLPQVEMLEGRLREIGEISIDINRIDRSEYVYV